MAQVGGCPRRRGNGHNRRVGDTENHPWALVRRFFFCFFLSRRGTHGIWGDHDMHSTYSGGLPRRRERGRGTEGGKQWEHSVGMT